MDYAIQNLLVASRSDFWTSAFLNITLLGNWKIIVVTSLVVVAIFWFWKKKEYIIPFLVVIIGGQLSGSIFKRIFARARPLNSVYHEDSFSFPSGHAIIAVVFYGFLMYFIWKNVADKFWRNTFLIIGAIVILAIGFSRIYLGLHYFTDVLGGYILGALWLGLGIYLHKRNN